MSNKDYWKQYSSILAHADRYELFVNTENGDWALYIDGKYVYEGYEDHFPSIIVEMMYKEFNEE